MEQRDERPSEAAMRLMAEERKALDDQEQARYDDALPPRYDDVMDEEITDFFVSSIISAHTDDDEERKAVAATAFMNYSYMEGYQDAVADLTGNAQPAPGVSERWPGAGVLLSELDETQGSDERPGSPFIGG